MQCQEHSQQRDLPHRYDERTLWLPLWAILWIFNFLFYLRASSANALSWEKSQSSMRLLTRVRQKTNLVQLIRSNYKCWKDSAFKFFWSCTYFFPFLFFLKKVATRKNATSLVKKKKKKLLNKEYRKKINFSRSCSDEYKLFSFNQEILRKKIIQLLCVLDI